MNTFENIGRKIDNFLNGLFVAPQQEVQGRKPCWLDDPRVQADLREEFAARKAHRQRLWQQEVDDMELVED